MNTTNEHFSETCVLLILTKYCCRFCL